MTEHSYAIIIVITYNLVSPKTSFSCYYKPYLPKIYFGYSAWASFRDPSFDFEFETIERFRFFISLGTKSHIFGPRKDTNSEPYHTDFTLLLLNELLLRRS